MIHDKFCQAPGCINDEWRCIECDPHNGCVCDCTRIAEIRADERAK